MLKNIIATQGAMLRVAVEEQSLNPPQESKMKSVLSNEKVQILMVSLPDWSRKGQDGKGLLTEGKHSLRKILRLLDER